MLGKRLRNIILSLTHIDTSNVPSYLEFNYSFLLLTERYRSVLCSNQKEIVTLMSEFWQENSAAMLFPPIPNIVFLGALLLLSSASILINHVMKKKLEITTICKRNYTTLFECCIG